jgi:hypothetical protein
MNVNSSILTWLRQKLLGIKQYLRRWRLPRGWASCAAEWLIILIVAYLYCGQTLLDFDARQLQQTGEHNESVTLPLLAEIGLQRYGEIPLWNPYMLTGFPHTGDFIGHFWNPISTVPIMIWGGVNGMKVSIFISLVLAGMGQWLFAHVFGTRSIFRLWSALMFMLSGGLALLWRLGWYELLVGAVWFPWCFAALWWALHKRDRVSIIITAVFVFMVISTGGGYYPIYLLVCLSVLVGMALLWAPRSERWPQFQRATAVATLSAGLLAVVLLPLLDGFYYTARDILPDEVQRLSQPISYALINYIVGASEWFGAEVLEKGSGYSWFYIGFLPLLVLTLLPLAYSRARWHRTALSTLFVLALILLAWQANRYSPFKYIYDWIPFLYTFRFPNRLLIIATSPLIVLAGLGLQHLRLVGHQWSRGLRITVTQNTRQQNAKGVPVRWIFYGVLVLILAYSLRDVYRVNQGFAFAVQRLNATSYTALNWLKEYDPGLYYTNLGGGVIYWDWMPAAYDLEMPIINFRYGRRLVSMDAQQQPESPFLASAKYILALPDHAQPDNAELVRQFDEINLWHFPEALPFAFEIHPALLGSDMVKVQDVTPLTARFDGPNRVVVEAEPGEPENQLVVLVSNYPGWHLLVDGQQTTLQPANGYLGAIMEPGEHTYTFVFRPRKYYAGVAISALTLIVVFAILLVESPLWPRKTSE